MRTILDEIVATKRAALAAAKAARPLSELKAAVGSAPPLRDFFAAVAPHGANDVRLIAEIKQRSPSAGIIRPDFDPATLARAYKAGGAAALSVLTDGPYFGGRLEHLATVRAAVDLPLLRKDFLVDVYQVFEARVAGADAVLLIAEVLDDALLAELLAASADLGMAVLLEVHDEASVSRARAALTASGHPRALLGINNRDLRRQVTDLATFERLAPQTGGRWPLVAESGLKTPHDVERVRKAGARAVLVGESLLAQSDVEGAARCLMATTE